MTELIYFTSNAIEADAEIQTCVQVKDGYEVTLDRTVFHPQGGGQLSDTGFIGKAYVKKVTRKGDALLHRVDQPLAIGPAKLRIDAQKRELHSRLHTAGHLIGYALSEFGLQASHAMHWPDDAWVMTSTQSDKGLQFNASDIQTLVDDMIAKNLPQQMKLNGSFREIAFGDMRLFPCGGTHVSSTGKIGQCHINGISENEKGVKVRYSITF